MISTDRAQDQQYRIGALASFGMLESRPVTQETVTALEAGIRNQRYEQKADLPRPVY